MTVRIEGKESFTQIRHARAADLDFVEKHREMLKRSLAGAPYISLALAIFEDGVTRDPLVRLLEASIERSMGYSQIGAPKTWLRSSTLGVDGTSSARLVNIVSAVGGYRYVTAHGANNYLDYPLFEATGISVEYIDYSYTTYNQMPRPFTPYVSILDLIGNVGCRNGACFHPRTVPWRDFRAALAKV